MLDRSLQLYQLISLTQSIAALILIATLEKNLTYYQEKTCNGLLDWQKYKTESSFDSNHLSKCHYFKITV